jgi:hypothetical protein
MTDARISITYAPRPDLTPEAEAATLASVYRFVLRCGETRSAEEKKATRPGSPDDVEVSKSDHTAEPEYRR